MLDSMASNKMIEKLNQAFLNLYEFKNFTFEMGLESLKESTKNDSW